MYSFGLGSAALESFGISGFPAHSQLLAQGRRTTSLGATTLVSARLFWNPSAYQDSQLIPNSRLKVGGRPPLELQLWSRLCCFGIFQDSQLSVQGIGERPPWSYNFGLGSAALESLRIPISRLKVGRDDLLWSYSFGLSSTALESFRIPSSWLKVGGRPPLELQLWSRLGCFVILHDQDSQLSAQGRTTSFGATTLVSARLLWNPS